MKCPEFNTLMQVVSITEVRSKFFVNILVVVELYRKLLVVCGLLCGFGLTLFTLQFFVLFAFKFDLNFLDRRVSRHAKTDTDQFL
jgi:hypothetical protein